MKQGGTKKRADNGFRPVAQKLLAYLKWMLKEKPFLTANLKVLSQGFKNGYRPFLSQVHFLNEQVRVRNIAPGDSYRLKRLKPIHFCLRRPIQFYLSLIIVLAIIPKEINDKIYQ